MGRGYVVAAVALLSVLAPVRPAEPTEVHSLPELARSALDDHETVERALSAIRRARADVRLTSSALLPRLELNGSFTRYREELGIEFAPGEQFVIRPLEDWNWSADLRQTLFYGLRDWRARDVARLERDITELEYRTVIDDLVLEVARRFLGAVAAGQRVDVRRAALEQIESQLTVAERRWEVGETTIADVARWRAEAAAAEQAVVEARGDAELALRRLERLTAVEPLERLHPPGTVPVPTGGDRELVNRALEERLEMEILRHQLEAAGMMIKVERGAWLPEVEAHAQYLQQKSEFPAQDWISLTLSATVPIYDGGLTAARVAQAKEDLRDVELLEREVRKSIADQVDAAAIAFRAAVATYDAARKRRVAATEAHRQVERAYRAGEATSTDLLEVTAELTEAENSVVIARAEKILQAVALRRSVGLSPLPDLEPPAPRPGNHEPEPDTHDEVAP